MRRPAEFGNPAARDDFPLKPTLESACIDLHPWLNRQPHDASTPEQAAAPRHRLPCRGGNHRPDRHAPREHRMGHHVLVQRQRRQTAPRPPAGRLDLRRLPGRGARRTRRRRLRLLLGDLEMRHRRLLFQNANLHSRGVPLHRHPLQQRPAQPEYRSARVGGRAPRGARAHPQKGAEGKDHLGQQHTAQGSRRHREGKEAKCH